MPHRFALALGLLTLIAAFISVSAGAIVVGSVLTLIVTAPAVRKFSVRFGMGCFISLQFDRRGGLPIAAADRAAVAHGPAGHAGPHPRPLC